MTHGGGGLGFLGMVMLLAGAAQIGLISSRYRAHMNEWLVALVVFGGIVSTLMGLAFLLF